MRVIVVLVTALALCAPAYGRPSYQPEDFYVLVCYDRDSGSYCVLEPDWR